MDFPCPSNARCATLVIAILNRRGQKAGTIGVVVSVLGASKVIIEMISDSCFMGRGRGVYDWVNFGEKAVHV